VHAISHANRILYWQENLDEDEMPPQWMFPYDEPLNAHFEKLSEARKEKYGGSSGGMTAEEEAGMLGNDLSPGR
jgi:hypothetical protein